MNNMKLIKIIKQQIIQVQQPMDNTGYYNTLEVKQNASIKQIANAFRKLSLKWHPKLSKQNPNTSYRNFCEVAEAYEVLSDQERRSIYDKYGENKLKEGIFQNSALKGGYKFSGNPEEIFQHFFGTKNPYGPLFEKESNQEARSIFSTLYPEANIDALKDLVVKIDCTLLEQFNGCKKKISYQKQVLNKDGKTTNTITESKEIEIKPGMSENNKLVFNGLGHQQAGIANSDLIFEIQQVNDPLWKRKGNDLIYLVNISLLDALESKPFTITTLRGKYLNLAFDEVITPQTVRQIEGEGMPIYLDGASPSQKYKTKVERGNLYVKFNINFPTQLNEAQKKQLTAILGS